MFQWQQTQNISIISESPRKRASRSKKTHHLSPKVKHSSPEIQKTLSPVPVYETRSLHGSCMCTRTNKQSLSRHMFTTHTAPSCRKSAGLSFYLTLCKSSRFPLHQSVVVYDTGLLKESTQNMPWVRGGGDTHKTANKLKERKIDSPGCGSSPNYSSGQPQRQLSDHARSQTIIISKDDSHICEGLWLVEFSRADGWLWFQ